MNIYEGVCRYCGSMISIMANSQEEADRLATESCKCEASELDQKARLLIGDKMFRTDINSVQIGFDHSSIRIWKTGDKIKVKRTAKVEQTREA